jgi:2-polyprenyl-6-methoxyphenol hydroxylase-like FAD-dependent oxidoreductase
MRETREKGEMRILIAGAGIAGLSLAIALRRRGLGAEVIERADAWPASGAGLYLLGAATRVRSRRGSGRHPIEGASARVRRCRAIRSCPSLDRSGKELGFIELLPE